MRISQYMEPSDSAVNCKFRPCKPFQQWETTLEWPGNANWSNSDCLKFAGKRKSHWELPVGPCKNFGQKEFRSGIARQMQINRTGTV